MEAGKHEMMRRLSRNLLNINKRSISEFDGQQWNDVIVAIWDCFEVA
jgi:hypothetical protein